MVGYVQKVLVAVDGSDSSQEPLSWLRFGPGRVVEAVTLISVTPAPSLTLQAMDFMFLKPTGLNPCQSGRGEYSLQPGEYWPQG